MSDSERALEVLRARGVTQAVDIGFVLGTGLGSIADSLEEAVAVPFGDLPGFPVAHVSGHEGKLVIGAWEGTRVAIVQGRAHYYESGNAAAMRGVLETLVKLGIRTLVLTNSAGSLHPDWHPGSIVMISDHINYSGLNPLIGGAGDDCFVPMGDAYDRNLRFRMRRAAGTTTLREGVYMWFSGPSFETAAEIKAAKLLGADLVGMSTVPEVILARYLGLKVVALSVITNFATGIGNANPTHAETKATALTGSVGLKRMLRSFIRSRDTL